MSAGEQGKIDKKPWPSDDTLKLLDLIKNNQDWEEISNNFEKRTREEIILHFLQLPLRNISSFENDDEILETNKMFSEKIGSEELQENYSNPLMN